MSNDTLPSPHPCTPGDDGANPESLLMGSKQAVCGNGPAPACGHAKATNPSDAELALDCNETADELEALMEQFKSIGWDRHSSYIQSWASHLRIYAHQLQGRAQGDAL